MNELKVDTRNQASDDELEALRIFKEDTIPVAREIFEEDGEIVPAAFIGTKSGGKIKFGILPVQPFMKNEMTKDLLSQVLRAAGEQVDPICICMVLDTWVAIPEGGKTKEQVLEEYQHTPVRDRDDKREAALYIFESENIQWQGSDEILRDPNRLVDFPELNRENDGVAEGRFVGMLKDLKKMKNN